MAKALAGVLAVLIVALLFAGCGGSSTAGGSDAAVTQLLAQCANGYSDAAAKMNQAGAVYGEAMLGVESSEISTLALNYVDSIRVFNDEVSRLSCSEQVEADIRSQVEAGSILIFEANSVKAGTINGAAITAANAKISSASTLIRAALDLPPTAALNLPSTVGNPR
jgi:hypothetical protein